MSAAEEIAKIPCIIISPERTVFEGEIDQVEGSTSAGLVGRVGSRFDAHRFAGLNGHVLRAMQSERYRTDRRACAELGLIPTPIEDGIAEAYAWFKSRGYC